MNQERTARHNFLFFNEKKAIWAPIIADIYKKIWHLMSAIELRLQADGHLFLSCVQQAAVDPLLIACWTIQERREWRLCQPVLCSRHLISHHLIVHQHVGRYLSFTEAQHVDGERDDDKDRWHRWTQPIVSFLHLVHHKERKGTGGPLDEEKRLLGLQDQGRIAYMHRPLKMRSNSRSLTIFCHPQTTVCKQTFVPEDWPAV